MSSVTMLKHDIIYKSCLEIFYKSCLKRLKVSAQVIMQASKLNKINVSKLKSQYIYINKQKNKLKSIFTKYLHSVD